MNVDDRRFRLEPLGGCQLYLTGIPEVGRLRLWVPEGILSNTGASSVYPQGKEWMGDDIILAQRVEESQLIGGGNCPLVDPNTFECCGVRFPLDSPVEWQTTVTADGLDVRFSIAITNVGDRTIEKAGAAICMAFIDHPTWWSDEGVFVLSNGAVTPLSEMGRSAGADDVFEAYLVEGESYDHAFYHQFWGFNPVRLDRPVMMSENSDAGCCLGISADRAYFLHSNAGNPCTDVMLAFGDLRPGETVESSGEVWVRSGKARDLLREYEAAK